MSGERPGLWCLVTVAPEGSSLPDAGTGPASVHGHTPETEARSLSKPTARRERPHGCPAPVGGFSPLPVFLGVCLLF